MCKKKIKIAICYDFDGTLAPGNMQEHSLLPELNLVAEDFWHEVKELAKRQYERGFGLYVFNFKKV